MYAQMLTRTSVRKAPASPESMYLVNTPKDGSNATNAGITYVAVTSAMMPAKNPRSATKAKTLNLSPNFPPSLELNSKPLFSLTYTFLSNPAKTAKKSFHYKIKA